MATQAGVKSAVRRARRGLARRAARPRRALIWTVLRRRGAAHGYSPQDLDRFYRYLSIHLKLEKPEYTESLQKPADLFPGLRARPIHSASDFPWMDKFTEDFESVRKELLEYSSEMSLAAQPQGMTDQGRWSVLYFYSGGRRIEETMRACPRTAELLESVPGVGDAGNTYLSVLRGGTHIKRHFGRFNTRLRCHLPLIVPEGPRIRIGDEMHEWREGEWLVFDDSFDHEVWNDSDQERIVLIIDFWHPDLTPAERWAIAEARKLWYGLRDLADHAAATTK
jgi:aspartyl/asparaginyl beta-hydroxylase (cupin superfamily)